MKKTKTILLYCMVSVMMISVSCTRKNDNTEIPFSQTPVMSGGSVTPSWTPTPSPTGSPTPTGTLPLIATLPMEEARTKLLDLLANNGNCRLPCLWGISPGRSTFLEARTILMPLSSVSSPIYLDTPGTGGISPSYDEGDLSIYTRLRFLLSPNDEIVSRISFQVEAHKKIPEGGYEYIFDSMFFGERVEYYMLHHVLAEQGIPAAVIISTLAEYPTRGGQSGFWMILFYPDQGILASYTTSWQISGTNVLGCFSTANAEFELYPSGYAESFSRNLGFTKFTNLWPVPENSPTWKPIEEATSMSLEEFYQTFSQPTNQCIETPANLWPIPER